MKCFIPAAGFGTRMADLTKEIPKPLLKFHNYTLLEIAIARAYSFGIDEFIINAHYHYEKIVTEISKYSSLKIHLSIEKEKILGTAGGIKKGIHGIIQKAETFLVLNPDSIFF
ncbi:MAG: sugar phosphate nucleotidyltransferase [Leptospiraceae bacterium]|nr:sugar phosphate nucleotidyltransferase [Leptospiraceae bacterium]